MYENIVTRKFLAQKFCKRNYVNYGKSSLIQITLGTHEASRLNIKQEASLFSDIVLYTFFV